MGATVAALHELDVEVVLHAVSNRIDRIRHQRLVLRRTVTAGPAAEHRVEQLWTSPRLSIATSRQVLDEVLDRSADALLLARPVGALPDMTEPGATALDELDDELGGTGASTTLLVAGRTRVRVGDRSSRAVFAEVVGGPSLAGHHARAVLSAAVARLGLARSTDVDDPSGATGAAGAGAGDPGAGEPGAFPGGITRASAAARGRLDQLDRWHTIAAAKLEMSPSSSQPAHLTDPQWLTVERTALGDAADSGRPDSVVVTFVGVTGGVIGPDAGQTNLFQYKVSPRIDLRRALGSRAVKGAFAAYAIQAAQPDVGPAKLDELRTRAVDTLRTALPDGETDWRAGEKPVGPRQTTMNGHVETLNGTVVLQDCRGIQVGNHVTQFNTFGYVLAPDVKASTLLTENRELAEAIVDHACSVNGPALRSVQQDLADAVGATAEGALTRAPGSATHSLPATVLGGVGQLAGDRGRQTDITSVRVDPLTRVGREIRRVQLRVEATRRAEIARIEAEAEAAAERVRLADLARPREPALRPKETVVTPARLQQPAQVPVARLRVR